MHRRTEPRSLLMVAADAGPMANLSLFITDIATCSENKTNTRH